MFNNLGRLFDSLDTDSGSSLAVGRGSVGSIRSFQLPFIPEECCEEEPLIPLEDDFAAGTDAEALAETGFKGGETPDADKNSDDK
jgi:hypothetical protein